MALINTPLYSSLKEIENLAFYLLTYLVAGGFIGALKDPLSPHTKIKYTMGFTLGMTGMVALFKARSISRVINKAQLLHSDTLQKRIIAFKNEYNKRALLAATIPVGSMGLMYAVSHVIKGSDAVLIPDRIVTVGLVSSAVSNIILEIWGVNYKHIPRIK